MNLLVAYDISDDARRLRLANALSRQGVRIQRSVFEVVTRQDADNFRAVLEGTRRGPDANYDSVLVQPVCERCRSNRLVLGHDAGAVMAQPFWIV